jgi:hypothetical protein
MPSRVMTEVNRMANDPMPVARRPPRIAALERGLDDLHRVEEVLVVAAIAAGQPAHLFGHFHDIAASERRASGLHEPTVQTSLSRLWFGDATV